MMTSALTVSLFFCSSLEWHANNADLTHTFAKNAERVDRELLRLHIWTATLFEQRACPKSNLNEWIKKLRDKKD